jgi:predicted acyltransferase
MSRLVNQPSPKPTRKLSAVGIAGALTAALIAGVNHQWPGVGDQIGPAAGYVIPLIVAWVAGYFTRERAE